MDIPASNGGGTGGSSNRLITGYGTTKYVPIEVSGDGPGNGSNRNISRSPRTCSDRAGLNDRIDRFNISPRGRNITPEFLASGNHQYRNISWNIRNDQISDRLINYKHDDRTQTMDNELYIAPAKEGLKGSGATSDLNVPVPYCDKDDRIGEQRDLRSSADDHALCDNRYIAPISYGVSVFEQRGAIKEGSTILTGQQLLKLNRSFRKPDVLDTVRSEASSLGQYLRSSDQIPNLINLSAQILEEIKKFPKVYVALNGTSALKNLQSYVSGSAGPDVPASSSAHLDLVDHSLKLINSVFNEQQAEVALSSQLPRASDPGGVGPNVTGYGNVELIVNSSYSGEKDLFAKWSNEEQKLPKTGEIKERENEGKSSDDVKGNTGEKKEPTYGKSHYAFKCALVEFVKELLSPTYNKDLIDKESFKIIVKKVVNKVISSVKSKDMPRTPENIDIYLSVSRPNILRLVEEYIERFGKNTASAARK